MKYKTQCEFTVNLKLLKPKVNKTCEPVSNAVHHELTTKPPLGNTTEILVSNTMIDDKCCCPCFPHGTLLTTSYGRANWKVMHRFFGDKFIIILTEKF